MGRVRGEVWGEADRLFRGDPTWLGSDDAYSVPLGGDRTLWLFGDTFLGADRRHATFVSTSVAVQYGLDPTTATLERASGLFRSAHDGEWLWPLDGTRLPDGALLLFFMRVRSTRPGLTAQEAWAAEGSLGFFDVVGWAARRIDNPDDPPTSWRIDDAGEGDGPALGTAVVVDDEYVLAYAHDNGSALLARWRADQAPTEAEWWTGAGWSTPPSPPYGQDSGRTRGLPGGEDEEVVAAVGVVTGVPTEFTVHRRDDGYLLMQIADPFTRVLQARRAPAPQGPWSEPEDVLALPAPADDVICYAAKAHPELETPDGALAVTYASIALTRDRTLDDDGLYYPRFVLVRD